MQVCGPAELSQLYDQMEARGQQPLFAMAKRCSLAKELLTFSTSICPSSSGWQVPSLNGLPTTSNSGPKLLTNMDTVGQAGARFCPETRSVSGV